MNIPELAEELNRRASESDFRIGRLQEIRALLHGHKRRAGSKIFGSRTIFPEWAWHYGGRKELQFNIGLETGGQIRHGVAFSLESSRSVPGVIDHLLPKIRSFNDLLETDPEEYADLRMWHHGPEGRSKLERPTPIPASITQPGYFIFLGFSQPSDQIECDEILQDFDRLLPLYEYVEDPEQDFPKFNPGRTGIKFVSGGFAEKRSVTIASRAQATLEVSLRHNLLQMALGKALQQRFGESAVGSEIQNGQAGRVDVVVQCPDGWWFYEIKTAGSARLCIRQALAQLLEYSFWPRNDHASRLVIVGEPRLDDDAESFLRTLREKFGLPIFYQQLDPERGTLTPSPD